MSKIKLASEVKENILAVQGNALMKGNILLSERSPKLIDIAQGKVKVGEVEGVFSKVRIEGEDKGKFLFEVERISVKSTEETENLANVVALIKAMLGGNK